MQDKMADLDWDDEGGGWDEEEEEEPEEPEEEVDPVEKVLSLFDTADEEKMEKDTAGKRTWSDL